jgi:putative FmdB family regulatory protein
MPMFEYVCRECGERFEELRSVRDDGPLPECPACGSTEATKLFSAFATSSAGTGGGGASSCGGSGRFT